MTGSPHFRAFLPFIPHRKLIGFLLVGVLLLSCSGCSVRGSRARGVYHRVKSGETLSIIARAYHVNVQELAEVNNIRKPDEIAVGSVVFIPDASQVLDDVLTESRLRREEPDGERLGGAPAAETKGGAADRGSPKGDPEEADGGGEGKRGERVSAEAAAKDRAALARAAERDMASRRVSEKGPVGEAADRPAKKREENGSAGEIQSRAETLHLAREREGCREIRHRIDNDRF